MIYMDKMEILKIQVANMVPQIIEPQRIHFWKIVSTMC